MHDITLIYQTSKYLLRCAVFLRLVYVYQSMSKYMQKLHKIPADKMLN